MIMVRLLKSGVLFIILYVLFKDSLSFSVSFTLSKMITTYDRLVMPYFICVSVVLSISL